MKPWQVGFLSLSVLTPHSYNRISSLIFPHSKSPNTVPESYYDDPGDHGAVVLDSSTSMPDHPSQHPRANATLLMLARNSDLDDVVRSVRELEDRFNRKYNYPWVFLNEEQFTDDFKRYVPVMPVLPSGFVSSLFLTVIFTHTRILYSRVSVLTSGSVHFGQIPNEHWYQPSWIDEGKAEEERRKMEEEGVIYGGSVSYAFPFSTPYLL